MKALFLIFHGFQEANGISKKIRYQVHALEANGMETHLCYLSDEYRIKRRMIDQDVLVNYGTYISVQITMPILSQSTS